MKKNLCRIICFLIILLCVLTYVNKIFSFKYIDGIYSMTKFYELEENTVDVLFLGSSHAFESFNTGVLWEEHGMASYVLGGSLQPMWNTYYYLKEALKTQKPQLIVLEAYQVVNLLEYSDDSRIIKNTYGMHWSLDKLEAIQVSVPEHRRIEFLLEYMRYHTRYSQLSGADFYENQGESYYEDWKGFCPNTESVSLNTVDLSYIRWSDPLYEKTEMYYRKTIELALEHQIPILVVVAPYAGVCESEMALYNMAGDIAAEYGVPFLNYNLMFEEVGMDFSIHAADKNHLNYIGNMVFTSHVGNYIVENYDISDRRGDERYSSWEANAAYIRAINANQEFIDETDINKILEKMIGPNYHLIITVDGTCTTQEPELAFLLAVLGVPTEYQSGIWYRHNENGIVWYSGEGTAQEYAMTQYHDILVERIWLNESQTYQNRVCIDNIVYKLADNGINILVYDEVTQSVVDVIGFNKEEGYSMSRFSSQM